MKKLLGNWLQILANRFMSVRSLRTRAIASIRSDYFADLRLRFSLGEQLWIPLCFSDSAASFSEIFLQREHELFLRRLGPVRRWVDLGCNNGYFSLQLASQLAPHDLAMSAALLVDADPRSGLCISRILDENPSLANWQFLNCAVGPECESVCFNVLPNMFSRISKNGTMKIPVASQDYLMSVLPPPYDLLKIDIEGAEVPFFENYQALISKAHAVIVEWHSWNAANMSSTMFSERLARCGLEVVEAGLKREFVLVDGIDRRCETFYAINQAACRSGCH
jgi:FkbM family methyltransferase